MGDIETLNKLKQFESLIKQCLTAKFGKVLPENKIALLSFQSFVSEDMIKKCNGDEDKLRGIVLRTLLDNVIDVRCKKELEIDGKMEEVIYGEYLQDALVEHYAIYFKDLYKFDIDMIPDMEEKLKAVTILKEKLGDDFDKLVLNSDANTLLAIAGNSELAKEMDEDAIKRHIEIINNANNINDKDSNINQELQENFDKKGQINILYLKGKQYVKYIDQDDVVHLVETDNDKRVSKLYKDKINEVGPHKKIDPSDFFNELTSMIPEENLTATEDINTDYVNHEEVNMLSFIHSANAYKDDTKEGKVTHNNDGTIHILENSNDVVVTENRYNDLVSSTVVKNDSELNSNFTQEEIQKQEDNNDVVLSPEKYEELCNKFKSGNDLNLEELRSLKKYEEIYMKEYGTAPYNNVPEEEIEEKKNETLDNSAPVLRMNSSDKRYAGFTSKYLVAYIVVMTICLGIILGAAIFKIIN